MFMKCSPPFPGSAPRASAPARRLCWRLLALVVLLTPLSAAAQGKIAGRVTDATTGEPLIGVNVVIEGTQQGSVTDVDGNYVIVNVRPGEYTLLFSYIGFQPQRIEGLRVVTGQTTRYDVEMRVLRPDGTVRWIRPRATTSRCASRWSRARRSSSRPSGRSCRRT